MSEAPMEVDDDCRHSGPGQGRPVMNRERTGLRRAVEDPPATAPYPRAFECGVTTFTGTRVHVRPITPQDAPRLTDFHEALSPRSVYMRFFSPHPKLSEREVQRFTNVDYADRMALVAEIEGGLVAIARYDRLDDSSEAEVAFVVADDWQHHGIGSCLLELLAKAAWLCGIDTFTATTLPENREMLHVFTHSTFHVATHFEGGVVEIRFPIAPSYHTDGSRVGERVSGDSSAGDTNAGR